MNEAKKLKYHEPTLRAVGNEQAQQDEKKWLYKRSWKVNPTVWITWSIVLALTVVFWLLIVQLF